LRQKVKPEFKFGSKKNFAYKTNLNFNFALTQEFIPMENIENSIRTKESTVLPLFPITHPLGPKIFVGGISPITTPEDFRSHFAQYGQLCDHVLMMDKTRCNQSPFVISKKNPIVRSRGFGFVTYTEVKIADMVVSLPHIIDGK
jgi:RNA recognition motif-containing protein